MPEDPVPFMLEWLEQKKIDDEEKLLSPEEKDRLVQENKSLQENVNKVKTQMQEAAMMAAATDDKDEEEEEEDDDLDEPPPDFFKENAGKARQSVSAEAYGEWNTKKTFVAPVIMKSDEQKERLRTVLSKSFLFMNLEDNDLNIVIGAIKEVPCQPGHRVIKQGDDGDFLFVIESGSFDCLIKKDGSDNEEVVKTCKTGDFFGELALLYNCPRKASVDSKEQGVVWQLDRDTFNAIVKEAAQKKRARYDSFLSKVPILQSMDAYERSQLADALRSETFSDGQTIMSQGEVGHKFYILEEGEIKATKGGVEVMTYGVGDYFGELALLRDQPRAATCAAKGPCKCLSLDSASFKRLL